MYLSSSTKYIFEAATITAPFEGSDDQEVSFTGLVLGDDASAEDQHEVEYNPFQGRDYLEGCSLTGLGSALSRRKTVVTPTSTQLALWRQVKGGRTMESMKVDVEDRFYSRDPLAKSFLDPEPPLDVPISAKQQRPFTSYWCQSYQMATGSDSCSFEVWC